MLKQLLTNTMNLPLAANTNNQAGGKAYSLSPKAALAQLAMTGCLNNTYNTAAESHSQQVIELSKSVDANYLSKLAIMAHQKGFMKDMPALLLAIILGKDAKVFEQTFSHVVNNPKMLRNFVQIIRSGVTGRKSLGSLAKRLICNYLSNMSEEQLFRADIGNDPSLSDIIKMVHPKPKNDERSAMYGYLLNKEHDASKLCTLVKDFESFKKDMSRPIPPVPFQMLTALPLTDSHWEEIAKNATWTQLRMNLNTFNRHNVFKNEAMVKLIADKLSNEDLIRKANVFPYQLMIAYLNQNESMPSLILESLKKATDIALTNIPKFEGKVYVMIDTSGSMKWAITGLRGTVTTKARRIDAAALFASAILKKNPNAEIIPFDTKVHLNSLSASDSVMDNAVKLAKFGGGGTDCSSALAYVNSKNGQGDLVIYISDNESWIDKSHRGATGTMAEWTKFKARNPHAKLINIDIQPSDTTQTYSTQDILNIGGFSDNIFTVAHMFATMPNTEDLWIKMVEGMII